MTITPADRDQLILKWQEAKAAQEVATATEREARLAVFLALFPDATEGTNTIELGMGYKLKAVKKLNYSLGNNDAVNAALERVSKSGNEGTFLAERIISWHPRLSVSEYRELPQHVAKIINEVLTITDGTPSLELVEPKAKK